MRVVMIGLSLVVLVGCSAAPGAGDRSPAESPAFSPDRSDLDPATPSARHDDEITGTLSADSVEGGCVFLETEDGTRYEVLWPDGWQAQASPLQLTDPDGETVAIGGETITVRGSEADMASICQVGPIFQASDVVAIE